MIDQLRELSAGELKNVGGGGSGAAGAARGVQITAGASLLVKIDAQIIFVDEEIQQLQGPCDPGTICT